MTAKINRRKFVQTTGAAAVAAAVPNALGAQPSSELHQAPTMMTPGSVKPVVVSAANGNRFKNGGAMTCVQRRSR